MAYPSSDGRDRKLTQSPVARMAWVLSGLVCAFTFENAWLDPRLARRFPHRFPSFVPEAMGGTWLLVLMFLAIAVILSVVCMIFLLRDARMAMWKKTLTGFVVLAAVLLTAKWVKATGGSEVSGLIQSTQAVHSVTLRWNASPTRGARYNVYRGTRAGSHPDKLTPNPVDSLTFTDSNVVSGTIYFYVTRAVDPGGKESADSNETVAKIP
jgi:hypothetical protein